jgi:Uma2 family endonuclease
MLAKPKAKMTVDEFLTWAERQPGRHELVEGEVIAMSPERARHAEVKASIYMALLQAIRAAGVPCRVLPDGMTVRVSRQTAYEPDALVYCGDRLAGDAIEVPDPVIVVEVLSPGTADHDLGAKLAGYFQVLSVQHYLIVDPTQQLVIHHRRTDDAIETRIAGQGTLRLDPPGIELALGGLFAEV